MGDLTNSLVDDLRVCVTFLERVKEDLVGRKTDLEKKLNE